MRTMLIILLAWVVMVAVIITGQEKSEPEKSPEWAQATGEKLKDDAHAAAEKTGDTVKDLVQVGKQKAGEVATNVAVEVKLGVQKAEVIATNVAARAKEVTTNVVSQVKAQINDLTH